MRRRRPVSRFWLALLLTLLLLQGAAYSVHGSTYSDAVLADTPARYYRLGESSGTTAVDSSGNSQAGTYTGGVTLGASGAIQGDSDTAAAFDGSNAYVSLPVLEFASQSFSIEAWVYPTGTYDRQDLIFDAWSGSGTGQEIGLELYYNGIFFTFNGSVIETSGGDAYALDAWNHVVATYDQVSGTARLYVNGVEKVSGSVGPFVGSNPTLNLGAALGQYVLYEGRLDEVAVYLSVLSPTQIETHYTAAGYAFNLTPTPTSTTTETLTPTPAPWALATLPGSGLTYQVSYEVSVGDVMQFVALLVLIALSFIQMLVTLASRR